MIESFTEKQIQSFNILDVELSTVQRLSKVKPRSPMDEHYLEEANKAAFNEYYDLTRHIFLEEGKVKILVDKDMVKAANIYLESHGFNQYYG